MNSTAVVVQQQFSSRQIDIIRRTVATGLTDAEVAFFMEVCKHRKLNPFNREIYAFSGKNGKITIQVSIDGLRLLAERTGKYKGQLGPMFCGPDGQWREEWLEKTPPTAAKVGVLREGFDKPIWAVARYESYQQNTPIWGKMPDTMLAKCFSKDTEVLTDKGFQKFSEVTGHVLQVTNHGLEATEAKPFVQDYNGVMITLESDDLNFSVTPNHSMVTTDGKLEALDMYTRSRARPQFWIPRVVKDNQNWLRVTNEQIQLAAAFLADGSRVSNSSFKIEVSREYKVERLRSIGLYRYEGTSKVAGNQVQTATRTITTTADKARFVYDFALIDWLCEPDKSVKTEVILQLSQQQAKLLIDTMILFDGHTNKETDVSRFYTSRKEHLAAFELAACVAGYSVSDVKVRKSDLSSKENYCVTISERDIIPVTRWGRFYKYEKSHTSKREQAGLKLTRNVSNKVWCVTVPSGVIVVRRHGFSMLCGNCAESLALRRAFPDQMAGLYSHEETEQSGNVVVNSVSPISETLNRLYTQGKAKGLWKDIEGLYPYASAVLSATVTRDSIYELNQEQLAQLVDVIESEPAEIAS